LYISKILYFFARRVFSLFQALTIQMNIRKHFLLAAIFSFAALISYAQRGPATQADQAFAKGDYYDAATLYKKAFTKEKNKVKRAEIIFKVAESYRLTNDYRNQEVWYAKALKANYKGPEAIVRYADALKFNGKYDEAIVQYTNFKKADPSDPRGDLGIESSQQAQKWKDKPLRYRIENVAAINTKYSDFDAVYSHKDHRHIIFTSARQESMGKNNDGGTGEKYQDLYEAAVDKKGKWSSPKPLLEPINSGSNDGSAILDAKGGDMFFTRCGSEKSKGGNCEIYFTKRKGQTWDEPKLIPLSPDSSTVGQPAISADGKTLYFVSDMAGGQGGKDIWMTTMDPKSKEWGTPVNLGPKINTPEDEMFPYSTSDGTLYFSSKGHIGMGGLDIFKTKMTGNAWDEPVNMRYPVNSSADDFAFVVDETTGDKGFLSSDRESGKGSDDIYSWTLPPLLFTVSGKVLDADTKVPIEGATIELFGSDGSSIPFKTDKTGAYKFDLKPEVSYRVSATMKNYLNKYLEVSTVGVEQSKDYVGDFDFALRSTLRAVELPDIYYDLAKWDLRPESKRSLDGLIQTLNDNPTIVIELGSHTDSRPIPMTNDTLSQRRAQSVVDYLIQHGIDKDRLVAHGYGEHEPRVLDKDKGSFKAGDVMTDEFISKLKNTKLKEEAHQLNRRTEFKVIRTNFVKGQGAEESINMAPAKTLIIQDSTTKIVPKESTDKAIKVDVTEIPVGGQDVKGVSIDKSTDSVKTETKVEEKKGPGEIYLAKKGETYNTIAKAHSMTVKDLKTLNGLKGEPIYTGMELKVDMTGDYSDYDKKFYTLEKGENSWKILAKKLSMKEGDLKKLNKEIDEDQLHPGKKVRIEK